MVLLSLQVAVFYFVFKVEFVLYKCNIVVTMEQGIFYKLRDVSCQENAKVTLKNSDLWKKFHELDTEMIITKNGRRMFPSLQVNIANLDPLAHYCVLLELNPSSRCRYKYTNSGGWAPAGAEEAQSPQRVYLHPDSPATGEYWMSQPVSFGRLKLTNTTNPPTGHLVLSSMHKYQPRIVIAKTSYPRSVAWAPSSSIEFPETKFIAVTAYQNERITKLKIDNNPFAKGFRENGQSKRKRNDSDVKKGEEKDNQPKQPKQLKVEPSEEDTISPLSSPCSTSSSLSSPHQYVPPPPPPPPPYYYPYYPAYPVYPTSSLLSVYTPSYPYYSYYSVPSPAVAEDLSLPQAQERKEETRKFTDFSIKAITGYT